MTIHNLQHAYMIKADTTKVSFLGRTRRVTPFQIAIAATLRNDIECQRMPLKAAQHLAESYGEDLEKGMIVLKRWMFG